MDPISTSTELPDIVIKVNLKSSSTKVWNCVATSDGLAGWFMPNDLNAEEGARFHLDAGEFGKSPCEVIEVRPLERFAFRWGKDWTLSFDLYQQSAEINVLTLTHSGWDAAKNTEFGATHTHVRDNMEQGWNKLTASLKTYVESL